MTNDTTYQPPRQPGTWPVSRVIAVIWGPILILGVAMFLWQEPRPGPRVLRANCLSNLKQIGIGIQMYAESYQGRCPVDSANDPTLIGSMRLLSNELTSAKVFYCPGDSRRGSRAEADYAKLMTGNISYSYVPNQVWSTDYESTVIMALDRIDSTSAGSAWPRKGNHKDIGGNVLFNNGKVAFFTNLPTALKDKNGKEIVLSP